MIGSNKIHTSPCVFFILLSLMVGCSTKSDQDQLAEINESEIKQALTNKALKMVENLRNKEADAVLSEYGRLDEYVHIDNGNVIPWNVLEPQVREYLQTIDKNELYWDGKPSVILLNKDAAIVYGTHSHNLDGGDDEHRGEWTGVFQRIKGQWKLIHSHSSDKKTH